MMFAYLRLIQIDWLTFEVIQDWEQALVPIETNECQHVPKEQWLPLVEAYAAPELGHPQRIWIPNQPWSV